MKCGQVILGWTPLSDFSCKSLWWTLSEFPPFYQYLSKGFWTDTYALVLVLVFIALDRWQNDPYVSLISFYLTFIYGMHDYSGIMFYVLFMWMHLSCLLNRHCSNHVVKFFLFSILFFFREKVDKPRSNLMWAVDNIYLDFTIYIYLHGMVDLNNFVLLYQHA